MLSRAWLFAIIAGAANALAALFLTAYTKNQELALLLIAGVIYVILIYAFLQVLANQQVANAAPSVELIGIILVVIGGILVFQEKINLYNLFGLVLAGAAIVLINYQPT